MLFASVTHLVEELMLEILLTLKVKKYLILLVGTWRPTMSVIEQQPTFFLKMLIRNKASRFRRLE
jgi:hypothetical protein